MSASSAWAAHQEGKLAPNVYTGSLVTMCPVCEKIKHWPDYKYNNFTWNAICCDDTCYATWLLRRV